MTMGAGVSLNGCTMPSTADELAALRRIKSARRVGSSNQGLLPSKEEFMCVLSPEALRSGKCG